jgi:hypothetical protein
MQPSILRRLSCMFAQPFIGLLTLEISQLTVFGFRRDPGEPITFDFRKSPLRDLSLSLQGLSAARKSIFLPYDHMTRLYLDLDPPDDSTSSLSELLHAFHRCNSLKECTLFLHAGRELTPLPQVRLEHLQSLGIRIQQNSRASNRLDDLLNVIYFPSLSSLDIAYRMPSVFPYCISRATQPFPSSTYFQSTAFHIFCIIADFQRPRFPQDHRRDLINHETRCRPPLYTLHRTLGRTP